MSYRHDRRRKLIRRWQREGWREIKGATIEGGGRIFTAEPGTLPSVGGMNYAAWKGKALMPPATVTTPKGPPNDE